jgi:hypothetical protein
MEMNWNTVTGSENYRVLGHTKAFVVMVIGAIVPI